MTPNVLQSALSIEKTMAGLLRETQDISRQLAEALDRSDKVVISMLTAMRQEPIEGLKRQRRLLEDLRDSLPEEETKHFAGLLNGEQPESSEEAPLAAQVAANRRLLTQLLELDKRLSLKLGADKSFYKL
ncbi:MAG: hypothetical protein HUJ80_08205 [Firmicutes bacterium]|nr:hypothetical protein [Bacillota bacterium]